MIRTLQGLYMNDMIDDETIIHVKANVDGLGVVTVTKGEWYTDRILEYFERDMSEYTIFTGDNSVEVFFVQAEEPEDFEEVVEDEDADLFRQMGLESKKMGALLGEALNIRRR